MLAKAAQTRTAYAVWTGIGAVGTVIVGILLYKGPATAFRLFCLTTLNGSIIGLTDMNDAKTQKIDRTITGNYFEDFKLGQEIVHATPRTVT
ncbi:MAG: SMR family transporter, partial [Methyloceanibacter sp.]